jgi:uncharacterized lipoprotein YajG
MLPSTNEARRLRLALWARSAVLIGMALALTQCVPSRRASVSYQPPLRIAREPDAKLPPVAISVVDKRPTDVVGEPVGAFGEKEGVVLSEGGAPAALKKAFDIELKNEGFTIGGGGNELRITLSFFLSQFLHPLFHTKEVASIGLDVSVRRSNGTLVYNGFIVGQSEHEAETHFVSSGESTSDALNAAMNDAVEKALADPALQTALRTR